MQGSGFPGIRDGSSGGSTTPRFRILCVNHRDPFHPNAGGAERYLWEVLSRLDASQYEVTWRCESIRGRPSVEQLGAIRVVRRGGRASLHLVAPFVARGYDLVIESVAHAVPFYTGVTHRGPRLIILFHVHQSVLRRELPPVVAGIVRTLERTVRFERGTVLAISGTTRDEARSKLGVRGPIEVIPPGVDHSFFVPGSSRASPPNFVCLGRLRRYKRIDTVISAFAALPPPCALTVVGGGDDRARLEELARGVPGVQFTGAVSEEEKRHLLQQATALVIASEAEGFGLTILEAAATATPSVVVDLPIYREVVQDRVSGLLVPDGKTNALTEGMLWVRDHPELREGAAQFSRRFTWEATATEFSRLVGRILSPASTSERA